MVISIQGGMGQNGSGICYEMPIGVHNQVWSSDFQKTAFVVCVSKFSNTSFQHSHIVLYIITGIVEEACLFLSQMDTWRLFTLFSVNDFLFLYTWIFLLLFLFHYLLSFYNQLVIANTSKVSNSLCVCPFYEYMSGDYLLEFCFEWKKLTLFQVVFQFLY